MKQTRRLTALPEGFVNTRAGDRASTAIRSLLPIAFFIWFAIVIIRGAELAVHASGFWVAGADLERARDEESIVTIIPLGLGALAGAPESSDTLRMAAAAAIIVLATLAATLVTRFFRPALTLPVAFASGGLTLLSAAASTGSLSALPVPAAMIAFAWLCGNVALHRLSPRSTAPIVHIPLATAIGLGLVGTFLLLLATVSMLNTATVAAGAMLVTGALTTLDRHRLRAGALQVRAWQPATLTWFEAAAVGLAAGIVSFAMLGAFVPEIMRTASDAMRQHLPIAREIWQTGSVPEFAQLFASRQPIQGHLVFAVAYGLGGVTAAKLLQACIGLVAVVAVGGIGWLGGGRAAAVASAAIFATIPLGMWLLGHLYADSIAILFTATATVGVLLWQRTNVLAWLIVAGALLGFGFATKVAIALVIAAVAAGIFLIGRSRWHWRERVMAVLALCAGALVAVPWLLRSYAIVGGVPGLEMMANRVLRLFERSSPASTTVSMVSTAAAHDAGIGSTPLDLLLGPWTLTFDGAPRYYRVILEGEFGLALLLLLPLAFLGPRNRSTLFLAFTIAFTYLGWVLSDQVSRHLLPTLALASALAGIGVAAVLAPGADRPRQAIGAVARAGLLLCMLASLFYFLPARAAFLPVDLILGRQTAAEYVSTNEWAIAALAAADARLPPDTRVGYISLWEGPQAYTGARLVFLGAYSPDDSTMLNKQLGTSLEEVLVSLERLDVRYFIWDRQNTRPADWQSTLLSGEFLQQHTRILAGDRDAYLFEVLPDGGQFWGIAHPENLLDEPDFRRIRGEKSAWTVSGRVSKNDGALVLRQDAKVTQRVPVHAGEPYLLVADLRCPDPGLRTSIELHWLDENGSTLEAAKERVQPGATFNSQFLWRNAPDNAAFASVELGGGGGARCEFAEIGLFGAR